MQPINQTNKNMIFIQFTIVIFALLSFLNVKFSLFIIMALYIMFIAKWKPWLSLSLFIVILPLSNTELLIRRFGDIPGLDLANLFLFFAILMYLVSNEHLSLTYGEILVIGLILLVHGIAFVRSTPHLNMINAYLGTNMSYSKYVMSHLIKPIIYISPFILILGYVRNEKKLIYLHNVIILSMLICSTVLILFYVFYIVDKSYWHHVRNSLGAFFGLHPNDIAIFYIIAYPLILANFIYKKTAYSLVCLLLTLTAVILLYSRTAYVLVVFATIALFLLEKRKKWFLVFCTAMVLLLTFSGTTVKERVMYGLEQGDIETISAGRVGQIWPSVLHKLSNDPFALVFGDGRYAIIYEDRIQKGHPHNMYLEAVFDSGIVGLLIFAGCFGYIMKKLIEGIRNVQDEHFKLILKSAFLSIIVFLISGISGRHLFPDITNSYLWVIMALGLSVIKIRTESSTTNERRPERAVLRGRTCASP